MLTVSQRLAALLTKLLVSVADPQSSSPQLQGAALVPQLQRSVINQLRPYSSQPASATAEVCASCATAEVNN